MNNSPLRRNKFKEDIIYTPNPPKIGDKNNKSSLIVVNSCQTFQTSQKPLTNFGMKDYWYYTNLIEAVRTLLCLCYSFLRSPCCFYKSFFYSQIILCSLWLSQFLCFLQFLVLLSICYFQMCLRFFCILLLVFIVFFFVIYLIGLFWIHGSTQKKNRNWFTHLKKSKCLAFYEKYTCHPVLLSFWYGHNHWFTKHFS